MLCFVRPSAKTQFIHLISIKLIKKAKTIKRQIVCIQENIPFELEDSRFRIACARAIREGFEFSNSRYNYVPVNGIDRDLINAYANFDLATDHEIKIDFSEFWRKYKYNKSTNKVYAIAEKILDNNSVKRLPAFVIKRKGIKLS